MYTRLSDAIILDTRRCPLQCSSLVLIFKNFYLYAYPYPSQAKPQVNPFHSP